RDDPWKPDVARSRNGMLGAAAWPLVGRNGLAVSLGVSPWVHSRSLREPGRLTRLHERRAVGRLRAMDYGDTTGLNSIWTCAREPGPAAAAWRHSRPPPGAGPTLVAGPPASTLRRYQRNSGIAGWARAPNAGASTRGAPPAGTGKCPLGQMPSCHCSPRSHPALPCLARPPEQGSAGCERGEQWQLGICPSG